MVNKNMFIYLIRVNRGEWLEYDTVYCVQYIVNCGLLICEVSTWNIGRSACVRACVCGHVQSVDKGSFTTIPEIIGLSFVTLWIKDKTTQLVKSELVFVRKQYATCFTFLHFKNPISALIVRLKSCFYSFTFLWYLHFSLVLSETVISILYYAQ
jgi:hypothetical protein